MKTSEFETFRTKYRTALGNRFGEENVCPFWGNQDAKIVSISQAPSASVIKNQRPFSDKSGEKLRRSWYQVSDDIFYNSQNFYFTAVGMYYPGRNKKGGDLRPSLEFANTWLNKELTYLKPSVYLLIGGLSANFFFPGSKLTDLVMDDQEILGTRALVLPHPSPINIRWFKEHPEFGKKRLPVIRHYIHDVLGL